MKPIEVVMASAQPKPDFDRQGFAAAISAVR
jgi:hypothetical protein